MGPFCGPLSLCCEAGECPQQFCVSVRCWSPFIGGMGGGGMGGTSSSKLTGIAVEIREAAGTVGSGAVVASGTTDTNGNFCATLTTAGDYDVVATSDDYTGATSGPHALTCERGTTVNLTVCRRITVCSGTAYTGFCPVPGASWSISGPVANESGTTGGDGSFEFDYVVGDGQCPPDGPPYDEHALTITPPACNGLAPRTVPFLLTPQCNGTFFIGNQHFPLASGFAPGILRRFGVPRGISYSDDEGSACLNFDPSRVTFPCGMFPLSSANRICGQWVGTYTYNDPAAAKTMRCGVTAYNPGFCVANHPFSGPVKVTIQAQVAPRDCSELVDIDIFRYLSVIGAWKDCKADNPNPTALGLYIVPYTNTADDGCAPLSSFNVLFHTRITVTRSDATLNGSNTLSFFDHSFDHTPGAVSLLDPAFGQTGGLATVTGTCDGGC